MVRRAGEDSKDRGIRMVKGDGANDVETAQIILVRIVISMPGDNIKRGLVLAGRKERIVEFADQRIFSALLFVIKEGNRGLKVSCIGKTVGSNGS
jgi:hypothetical protein